jgi:RHS repeat-associated protein
MLEGQKLYAIHTDPRGAPVAVTDSEQRIIWQARYEPFGYAHLNEDPDGDGKPFTLNLRLPGQYYDVETQTHYNYLRDYDPRTGRYLTPDPLGLAAGINPYAYVSNDPLTRVDPLGTYQSDIHYYMTFFLATVAGIDHRTASTIATAAQYIDDNEDTRPLDDSNWLTKVGSVFVNQERLLSYHFVLSNADGKTDPASNNSDVSNPTSFQLEDLLQASQNAPTQCGRFQFLGEYLHAFEDTFSHRDENNIPYDALTFGQGLGHGPDGHHPDYTYNHTTGDLLGFGDWNVNESRTLEMEKEVFAILQGYGDPGKAKDFSEILPTLVKFNAFKADEEGSWSDEDGKVPSIYDKIAILNQALVDLGYTGYDLRWWNGAPGTKDTRPANSYSEDEAKQHRENYLLNADRTPLNQADFPGTILPK